MKSGILVLAALLLLVGLVWMGQGLGYVKGSFMTGQMLWFWGFASDRVGRIRIIRISLAATAAACALSAVAPNLDFLLAARIIAGASVCAILPTALVYVGDMVPFKVRQAVLADVLAAVA